MKKLLFCISVLALAACSGNSSDEQLFSLDYLPVENEGEYYFVDVKSGEKADKSRSYAQASYFYNDIAIVSDDGSTFYFIDKNFNKISNSTYIDLTIFNDGVAYGVKEMGHIEGINTSGEVIFTLDEADVAYRFRDGVSVFTTTEGEYGLVNTKGEIVIQPGEYDRIQTYYKDGMLPVAVETKKGCRWGVVTYDGKEVLPCEYDEVTCLDQDYICVKDDDLWGVVDRKNKEIIPIEYEAIYKQKDGNYLVKTYIKSKEEDRWGWLDSEGKEIIPLSYKSAFVFTNVGLASACSSSSEKYGFINEEGQWVIEPAYEMAYPFNDEELAAVKNIRDKWGLINEEGEYVVSARYDFLHYLGEGLYYVEKDEISGIINKLGETVVKMSDELEIQEPYDLLGRYSEVTSDYLDIDDVVNKMVADAKQLMVDDLSLSAFEYKFGRTLNSYGWATLASSENKYYRGSVEAYVDYTYDYSDNYSYDRIYYITKFRVQFNIDSYKVSRNHEAIAEKFSKAIKLEYFLHDADSVSVYHPYDSLSVSIPSSIGSILPDCTAEVTAYDWQIELKVNPINGVIR